MYYSPKVAKDLSRQGNEQVSTTRQYQSVLDSAQAGRSEPLIHKAAPSRKGISQCSCETAKTYPRTSVLPRLFYLLEKADEYWGCRRESSFFLLTSVQPHRVGLNSWPPTCHQLLPTGQQHKKCYVLFCPDLYLLIIFLQFTWKVKNLEPTLFGLQALWWGNTKQN